MATIPPPVRYLYLHGFLSSPSSAKASEITKRLRARGADVVALNLTSGKACNPISCSGCIDIMDRHCRGSRAPVRVIGSSMGGYLAARYACLHPYRVDRILLLNPAFNFSGVLAANVGAQAMDAWKDRGHSEFEGPVGQPVDIPWSFVEDCRSHPDFPRAKKPTAIVHGIHDEVVPIQYSRKHQAANPNLVRLVEVEDDHALLKSESLDRVERVAMELFELGG